IMNLSNVLHMKAKHEPVNLGHYPFLLPLISMIAGILWYQFELTRIQNFPLITVGFGFVLILSMLLHLNKSNSGLLKRVRNCFFLSVFILLGWILSYYHDVRNQINWMGNQLSAKEAFL